MKNFNSKAAYGADQLDADRRNGIDVPYFDEVVVFVSGETLGGDIDMLNLFWCLPEGARIRRISEGMGITKTAAEHVDRCMSGIIGSILEDRENEAKRTLKRARAGRAAVLEGGTF